MFQLMSRDTAMFLREYLNDVLPKRGDKWFEKYVIYFLPPEKKGIQSLKSLDIHYLLMIFDKNWTFVRQEMQLSDLGYGYLKQLRSIRNIEAHLTPENDIYEELIHHLGTLELFLKPLNPDVQLLVKIHARKSEIAEQRREELLRREQRLKEEREREEIRIREAKLREEELKQEAERKEAERKEAERREAERREAQRREAQRKEAERKEAERKEAERKEAERKEAERKEAERKEAERKEAERKEAERKEAERREAQRKEAQRKEAERKEAQRKEAQRRKEAIRQHIILVIQLMCLILPFLIFVFLFVYIGIYIWGKHIPDWFPWVAGPIAMFMGFITAAVLIEKVERLSKKREKASP